MLGTVLRGSGVSSCTPRNLGLLESALARPRCRYSPRYRVAATNPLLPGTVPSAPDGVAPEDWSDLAETVHTWAATGFLSAADLPQHLDDYTDGSDEVALKQRWRTDVTALANRVVEVMCAQGLPASWNEDPDRRIKVGITDWRRRLPAG